MMFSDSALDRWQAEKNLRGIATLCKELDRAIGDGIPLGAITQLVGMPGSGKTQFCLQLCANVQIPRVLCGHEAAAVFIDTNRGFTTDRLKEIAIACVEHCAHIMRQHGDAGHSLDSFTVDKILDNIFCAFCDNYVDLLAFVVSLRELIGINPNIRLIVIDSLSYVFRLVDSSLERTRMVYQLIMDLQKLATDFQCAVVVTNELTTRVINTDDTYITPALGDSFSHRVNVQIALGKDWENNELFFASIDKSFYTNEIIVPFKITKKGIRKL